MARYHGITSTTYQNLAIDSGAVYKNYGEAGEALLGATRGGNTFMVEQDIRDMNADGAKGPVKGARRIIRVTPKITANMLEIDTTLLTLALVGSSSSDQTTYDLITRGLSIATSDYVTNVAIIGETTVSGASVPVVCMIKNGIADGNFEFAFNENDESVISIEFSGHYDPSDLDTEPWEIRWPK